MKPERRIYNILLPIWLLILLPQMWLIVLPANLAVDVLVLYAALRLTGCGDRRAVIRRSWWKVWLFGFLADGVGALWMFLLYPVCLLRPELEGSLGRAGDNPFAHPLAFLWTLLGVAAAGAVIYALDGWALGRCPELSPQQCRRIALAFAVFTAPWLFFLPISALYGG